MITRRRPGISIAMVEAVTRTRDRTGRWPGMITDGLVASAVFAYNLPIQGFGAGPGGYAALLIPLGLCLPYLWRRRRPVAAFAAIVAVAALQLLAGVGLLAADVMLLAGLYGVARLRSWRWSVPAAAAVAGWVIAAVAPRLGEYFLGPRDLLSLLGLVLVAWFAGTLARTHSDHLASLRARAEQAEQERHAQVEAAAVAERIRIARELHDVVSHNLSAVGLLAAGAASCIDTDPRQARSALRSLEDSSRSAMQELRSMLGVLRSAEPTGHAPLPGIGQLRGLVEQSVALGVPVRMTLAAGSAELPAGVQLGAYRIVQEALTNVRTHAPTARAVEVCLRRTGDELSIMVRDDGTGPAEPDREDAGHGLIGMRERVGALGGRLRAGPRAGGGFEVVAALPVRGSG